ncbi:MAG TPA: nucleotidyl transferase AbiEii/AbiGii toxin family protein [Pyrinomonadaceae bacterium]|nr:nucleotidyl transferase AbiEii/AbiGii toxin family protein [Pyrinomonadaceae bacterium]
MINLNDPTAVLLATFQGLERANLKSAVCGGLALAVYGEPRETKDADLAIADVSVREAAAALEQAGLDVLLAFERVPFGGLFVSRITLFRGLGGSLNVADLIEPRSIRYAQEVMARAITGPLRGHDVPVVSPEDFVVLKILATRERDLSDACSVLRRFRSDLDLVYIEAEIKRLIAEVSDHDVDGRWHRAKEESELEIQ